MAAGGWIRGLARRFALDRPQARAWALYDWANSAMITVVVTAVFPIYYESVVAGDLPPGVGATRFAYATSLGILLVALLSPFLGALADRVRIKKLLLGLFMGLGVLAVGALFAVREGDWFLGLALFVLANVGAGGSFHFYDALLPHVARRGELDLLSTSGYALGYLGGGLLLALVLVVIGNPEWFGLAAGTLPVRVGFLLTAAWWLVFSVPLFLRVSEPPGSAASSAPLAARQIWGLAVGGLAETLRDLRRHPQALRLLIAFLIYNDGIATIIRMATIYGAVLKLGSEQMILAILFVQFAGIPCTLAFGLLAERLGTKRSILLTLVIYAGTSLLAWRMTSIEEFWLLAGLVALVQGGAQGLSRSLYASLIPEQRSAEFFSLFAVLNRFAGVLGAYLFALVHQHSGDPHAAILPVFGLFVLGGFLLTRVDVEAGRRQVHP